MTHLNEFFLACVHEKNSALLIRCLGIYVTVDKVSDAEDLVRKEIVVPLIHSVINIENLNTDLLGLQNIYNRLLNILDVELKQLLDITLHPNRYVFHRNQITCYCTDIFRLYFTDSRWRVLIFWWIVFGSTWRKKLSNISNVSSLLEIQCYFIRWVNKKLHCNNIVRFHNFRDMLQPWSSCKN